MPRQWLTTAPNPAHPGTGYDAGQRGWKLHAINAPEKATFGDVRFLRAACGLRGRYGWGLDIFIEDKCTRCMRALGERALADTPRE